MDNKAFQLGIYALSLAGYVTLALKGEATAEYVALVGPVLGAGFVMSKLGKQDTVLGKIHENTNGVLDQRIASVVTQVLGTRESGES